VLALLGAACGSETAGDTDAASSTGAGPVGSSTGVTTLEPTTGGSTTLEPTTGSAVTSSSTSDGTGGEAVCGDGVVAGDEECDDGDADPSDACLPGCVLARCGDLVLQIGVEECEDGNLNDQDNCTNMCKAAICGDGIVKKPGELCDDGNDVDSDECSNTCITTDCGDGVIQAPEDCDEGVETAACNLNCTESVCGDGIPNKKAGEDCDAGGESPTCDDDCTLAGCGDGEVNAAAGEVCDEGGDSAACDADCTLPSCGDGTMNAKAGEACDDGGESAACNADCSLAKCGDGKINAKAGETCDEPGEGANETCSSTCAATLALTTGYHHVCAIYKDGSLHCWGQGFYGQLGTGDKVNLGDQPGELPTLAVDVGGEPLQLSIGTQHTCARMATGSARCWGHGSSGELGDGKTGDVGDAPGELPTPDIAVGAEVLQVGVGAEHSCALISGGTVRCWGNGVYGRLGYGDASNLLKPSGADVVGISGVKAIAPGAYHTCALGMNGSVRCWGHNGAGQLGVGSVEHLGDSLNEMPPPVVKVGDLNDPVQQISGGFYHNCALLQSGKVRCWGDNTYGQVGAAFADQQVGDGPGEMPPPEVDLGGPAVQVLAGQDYSCALMKSKAVKCWGRSVRHGYANSDHINAANEFPPQDVKLGGPVASLSGHLGLFTCAVLVDDTVRCWGENASGQLGYGNVNPVGDNEAPDSVGPVPL